MLLEVAAQRGALRLAPLRERAVAARARDLGESLEHGAQEEAQPDALAAALDADAVHAVVPVARAHQRQAVRAESQPVLDRAHAMLVQARGLRGPAGQVVVRVVLRAHRPALEERGRLVEHRAVAGRLHVARRRERQPEKVVRAARAHAAARGRMPPVLHVAFHELAAGAAQQVLAHERGLGVHQRHHVLQLVAEAERASRLVVAAARPQAAGDRLVEQPAVGQHVERRVRRFHLDRAEGALPVRSRRLERSRRGGRSAKAPHELGGIGPVAAHAEAEDELALLAVGEVEGHLDGRAGIEPGAGPARKPGAAHRGGRGERAVAPEELGPVPGHGADRVVHVEERHAPGKLGVVGVASRGARRRRARPR